LDLDYVPRYSFEVPLKYDSLKNDFIDKRAREASAPAKSSSLRRWTRHVMNAKISWRMKILRKCIKIPLMSMQHPRNSVAATLLFVLDYSVKTFFFKITKRKAVKFL
jgi:hypothetical protein